MSNDFKCSLYDENKLNNFFPIKHPKIYDKNVKINTLMHLFPNIQQNLKHGLLIFEYCYRICRGHL